MTLIAEMFRNCLDSHSNERIGCVLNASKGRGWEDFKRAWKERGQRVASLRALSTSFARASHPIPFPIKNPRKFHIVILIDVRFNNIHFNELEVTKSGKPALQYKLLGLF